MEVLLVGVDDHVAGLVRSGSGQRLCDGERGTAVGKPDLDHRARLLSQEKVTQDIAIRSGHGDTLKVTAGADTRRAAGRQPPARLPDPGHQIVLAAHRPGIALWRWGFPRIRRSHVIPPVLPGITALGPA